MLSIAILASHNGSGFDAIYNAILDKRLNLKIAVIISNNSNAKILQKAKEYGIESRVVNNSTDENPDEKIYSILKEYGSECVFLSGYMKKISPLLTRNFTIINSHPSLLPKFGGTGMYGRFVHEAVIAAKERISGVTIHEVNEEYDAGKILLQKQLLLDADESVDSLEKKIKELEKKSIVEALSQCLK
jgi:phosphoribosylglycinamide formyltransferase 1